ncbi:hypothetical protein B0J13DRAFT_673906 [Dactylonectria estremocensis]|uniref:Uncharacterized protein n=1 Tax=Dactylonectria estremocensis TaxID=1079267 RepID=A0A9P9JAA8_9HYPO|nr:hypothetical protein B0J13DRAFT_673906 [Dactylonectria estremocensis]
MPPQMTADRLQTHKSHQIRNPHQRSKFLQLMAGKFLRRRPHRYTCLVGAAIGVNGAVAVNRRRLTDSRDTDLVVHAISVDGAGTADCLTSITVRAGSTSQGALSILTSLIITTLTVVGTRDWHADSGLANLVLGAPVIRCAGDLDNADSARAVEPRFTGIAVHTWSDTALLLTDLSVRTLVIGRTFRCRNATSSLTDLSVRTLVIGRTLRRSDNTASGLTDLSVCTLVIGRALRRSDNTASDLTDLSVCTLVIGRALRRSDNTASGLTDLSVCTLIIGRALRRSDNAASGLTDLSVRALSIGRAFRCFNTASGLANTSRLALGISLTDRGDARSILANLAIVTLVGSRTRSNDTDSAHTNLANGAVVVSSADCVAHPRGADLTCAAMGVVLTFGSSNAGPIHAELAGSAIAVSRACGNANSALASLICTAVVVCRAYGGRRGTSPIFACLASGTVGTGSASWNALIILADLTNVTLVIRCTTARDTDSRLAATSEVAIIVCSASAHAFSGIADLATSTVVV